MAFFEKKRRTSQEKAQRAQMSILARLLGCAYLIYIIVQLIQSTLSEENATDVRFKIGIAVFFLVASVVIVAITAVEAVRSYKSGFFKASSYTDDFASDEDAYSDSGEDTPGMEDGGDEIVDEDPDSDSADDLEEDRESDKSEEAE